MEYKSQIRDSEMNILLEKAEKRIMVNICMRWNLKI